MIWVLVSGKIMINIDLKMSTYKVLLKGVEVAISPQMTPHRIAPRDG